MNRSVAKRILDIQEMIRSDFALMEEYAGCQSAFLNLIPELTEKQQNILWDYLGVCTEIHLRMLVLAC